MVDWRTEDGGGMEVARRDDELDSFVAVQCEEVAVEEAFHLKL